MARNAFFLADACADHMLEMWNGSYSNGAERHFDSSSICGGVRVGIGFYRFKRDLLVGHKRESRGVAVVQQ